VLYTTFAAPLVNDSDDYVAVTGLPASSEDVITYGTGARLLSYGDSSRVDTQSAEAAAATGGVPVGSASRVSQQMYAMYRQRLNEERTRLFQTYPTSVHYTR
jgi:hypothetical protein